MKKATPWMIAAMVASVIAWCLSVWGSANLKKYHEAQGASAVLTADYETYKAWAAPIITAKTAEAAAEREAKLAALARADAADTAKAKIAADLAAEKAKTAALNPDTLSGSINLRIGAGQSYPTGDGRFSFSRPGAEATLSRFLEGEASQKLYEAERSVSTNLRDAIAASERENGNLGLRLSITTTELDKAIAAWGADLDALRHLRRSITGRSVKTAAISFGAGALTVIALHAVGVWK